MEEQLMNTIPFMLTRLNCSECKRYIGVTYRKAIAENRTPTPMVLCNLCTLSQVELAASLKANWYVDICNKTMLPSTVLGYSHNDSINATKARVGRWAFIQAMKRMNQHPHGNKL